MTLSVGAQIPAAGSCVVKVMVKADTEGTYVNQLAAGALHTDVGSNELGASSSLKVVKASPQDIPVSETWMLICLGMALLAHAWRQGVKRS